MKLVNHVGDFGNVDFCLIGECLNKVVQFSPKKKDSHLFKILFKLTNGKSLTWFTLKYYFKVKVKFSNKKIENC